MTASRLRSWSITRISDLCGDGEAGKFIDEGGGMHPGLGGKSPG